MSQLTTHVLDTSNGEPAEGIRITLQKIHEDGRWMDIATKLTNADGRISDFLKDSQTLEFGIYRLIFETGSYFNELALASFYPYIPVVFEIKDESHYHVPLLLNPFGYSTYRGS
jgi:5-hydroxyisourate hydrolase